MPVKLNSNVAGLVFWKSVIVKKSYPWSVELYPDPVVDSNWIPSTNIWSPTAKGAGLNPPIGVTSVQVTIPVVVVVDIPAILDIDIPLELLIVLIFCSIGFNPLGELIMFTDAIELEFKDNSITPWSVNCPVSGSIITISGTEI